MTGVKIRPLTVSDIDGVVMLDGLHTGSQKRTHWQRIIEGLASAPSQVDQELSPSDAPFILPDTSTRLGLAAQQDGRLVGYLVGEIRAWEFGSPPAGWIYAVGVHPEVSRQGLGSRLMDLAKTWFRSRGVQCVRTMVRREDVGLLRFFRNDGFTAGPFVELEVEL